SASLSQEMSVEDTAAEYLKSVAFIDEVTLDFDYESTLNARDVTITARYTMATAFLPLIGITTLDIEAKASAEELRRNLEISMMLDSCGSTLEEWPPRSSLLRPAAESFVDALITPDTAPFTTISIVPYAGSVNPGAVAFGLLGPVRQHTYSSCIEFNNVDY